MASWGFRHESYELSDARSFSHFFGCSIERLTLCNPTLTQGENELQREPARYGHAAITWAGPYQAMSLCTTSP